VKVVVAIAAIEVTGAKATGAVVRLAAAAVVVLADAARRVLRCD